MKAITTVEFKGVADGEIHPKTFKVDDPVAGDLAKVAVENKWAREVRDSVAPTKKEKTVEEMTTDELMTHAAANKIDLKGATKRADIMAAIQAASK